jgi:hypothetical protein
MKVEWVGIYEGGNITNERIHFRALVDIDLRYYAIYDSNLIDANRIFVGNRNCYWFSTQLIKAGDNVVLYTRAGSPNVEKRPNGTVFHFLFRGLAQPLYRQNDSCAVLFEIGNWVTAKK